ncbi:MAG TPA: type II CAAX endopeptidase family protein [Chthoniobacteraceae bacterium]|jgi:membrane protease YdiL (CAAX protease family)|nr:type II CAAX endopeptidase family protein [Chthoniobacteraceae bacterium]
MLAEAVTAVDPSHNPRALLWVLPLAAITVAAYGRWTSRVAACGGRVATDQSRLPDLFFTVALGLLFCFVAFLGFTTTKEEPALSVKLLLADAAIKLVVMAVFLTFLAVREVKFISLFGLRALSLGQVVGRAVLFLLAALPAMLALGLLVTYFSAKPEEQQIVSFFRDQAKHGDFSGLVTVFMTASIGAPLMEELLFRGYFYPTLKRFLGPIASAVLVSLLFAAFHANLAALPALFVLALCLTVAYECTGSLLVPMTMHALFNTTSLAVMYYQATHATPP